MAQGGVAALSLAEDNGPQAGSCAAIHEHTFQENILDVRVCVQILAMKDSFIIWVGTNRPTFQALDLAMMTPMDPVPVGSTLMGDSADSPGPSLAKRVAMKTKAQVRNSHKRTFISSWSHLSPRWLAPSCQGRSCRLRLIRCENLG